jgi:pimeloyl-[acyl-carrier protein] methyl ester esterase
MSLYVQVQGEGPDLVMIHGWGMHGGVWGPVLDELSARFKLHIVDLPGLGYSPSISPYTLDTLSDAVAQIAPDQVAVCGWSLGGQVALNWALRRPEQVNKLLLVGATPKFVNADDWTFGVQATVFREFAAQVQQDYRVTLSKFLALQAHGGDAAKETIRRLREHFFECGEPAMQDLQAGLDILLNTDLREELAPLQMPTLILHGDYDKLAPVKAGYWLAEHLPMARLQVCKGASHAPFLSHPTWFVEQSKEFLVG